MREKLIYKETKPYKERSIGYKDWWDKECTRKKRAVKRMYRKWRKNGRRREDYIRGRKE